MPSSVRAIALAVAFVVVGPVPVWAVTCPPTVDDLAGPVCDAVEDLPVPDVVPDLPEVLPPDPEPAPPAPSPDEPAPEPSAPAPTSDPSPPPASPASPAPVPSPTEEPVREAVVPAPAGPTEPPQAPTPPDDVGEAVSRTLRATVEAPTFPLTLVVLAVGFLLVQHLIDRRDPKLAEAPVAPDPELAFHRWPSDD